MAIGIDTFDLSMVNPETGRYLTANIYTVDGVTNADGSLRELSIGQLVMAICLKRAAQLESGYTDETTNLHVNGIIDLMEEMNSTSLQLEYMTRIEKEVLAGTVDMNSNTITYNGQNYTYNNFLVNVVGMGAGDVPDSASASSSDFITALEAKMDEMNSFSQRKMIELQSLTNKRDQSYDMISNILKSLNTVLVGNANNM